MKILNCAIDLTQAGKMTFNVYRSDFSTCNLYVILGQWTLTL
jgi:hypothetical protein